MTQNDISPALQARIDRLQNNADRLFALGNIRERCQTAIKMFHEDKQPSPFATWGAMLRSNKEYRFALSLTLTYLSTKDEIIQLVKGCQEEYLLQEVKEERERQIEDFARMKIASRWYQMKDDDHAWRVFSQNIPYGEKGMEEDICQFFKALDKICILTDILMGQAAEYGLNVDYEHVPGAKVQITDKPIVNVYGDVVGTKVAGNVAGDLQSATQPANNHQERNEEQFHFVHPELDDEEAWRIHDAVKRLVSHHKVLDICLYLKDLKKKGKVLLPLSPSIAYQEMKRMGMPVGDGYSEKYFSSCYKE